MRTSAFTLIELVLVMALLVILLAIVAPVLSKSLRGRGLEGEASRFLALTEYARSEAISQAVPVLVWVEPNGGRYGAEPRQGYDSAPVPLHSYAAPSDVQIQVSQANVSGNRIEAVSFGANGGLDLSSVDNVRFTDRYGASVVVAKGRDNFGYEIQKMTR